MKRLLSLLVFAVVMTGCAVSSTHQIDRRPDGTEVSTKAKQYGFLAGKSSMREFKASQTAKTQGLSVGQLDSEADVNPLAQTLGQLAMQGLASYMTGGASALRTTPAPPAAPAAPAATKHLEIPDGWKLVPKDDPSVPKFEMEPSK